jgi:translation initiation factor IF-2
MSQKRRVLEVAKDHNLGSKQTLEIFQKLGFDFKSHFNMVSDQDYEKFRQHLQKDEDSSSSDRPQVKIRRRQKMTPTAVSENSSKPRQVTQDPLPRQEEKRLEEKIEEKSLVSPSSSVEQKTNPFLNRSEEKRDESSFKSSTRSTQMNVEAKPSQNQTTVSSSRSSSGFRAATIIRKATPSEKARALSRSNENPSGRRSFGPRREFRSPRGMGAGAQQPGSTGQGPQGGYKKPLSKGANSLLRGVTRVGWSSTTTAPPEDGKPRRSFHTQKHKDKRDLESATTARKGPKKAPKVYGLESPSEEEVFKRNRRGKKKSFVETAAVKKPIHLTQAISVSALAQEMAVKVSAVVKTLMKLGSMATANQLLDVETGTLVAEDMGYEVKVSTVTLDSILGIDEKEKSSVFKKRPPVVVIMGHVDHGKTSLLDKIRQTNVADSESGGITQKIGAYQVDHDGQVISFLDTPGHEAFTAMRARGAELTDIVVLIVAADDGVMPQTKEAIAHAQASKCPIIVAINKIDKPGYQLDKLKAELVENGLVLEEWGGEVIVNLISAKTGEGIPELLESIKLQTDLLALKSPYEGPVKGVVIEARLDRWKGPVATLMVQEGTLKVSQKILVGSTFGRVRNLQSYSGENVTEASPSVPVEVSGLDSVPTAGDVFYSVESEDVAKEAISFMNQDRQSVSQSILAQQKQQLTSNDKRFLKLIVKAESQGALEAVISSLQKLSTEKVKNQIVHQGVGLINESDLMLAKASHAVLVGFNAKLEKNAVSLFEREKFVLIASSIIYDLNDKVQKVMLGELDPVKKEVFLGEGEVRNVFKVSKMGQVAGIMVTSGKVTRNCFARAKRNSEILCEGKVESLKRFKQEVKEVLQGFECGVFVSNYNDVQVSDRLEFFEWIEEAPTLV